MSKRGKPEPKRIVHYAEGDFGIRSAKMTVGVIRYGIHESVAVIDSSRAGETSADVIQSGNVPVVASLQEALPKNPQAMLIGITPVGGRLSPQLRAAILEAIEAGLDVHAGLHDFLTNDPEICAAAKAKGVQLWDIRKPRPDLPVGKGRCRQAKSYIALMVGTDCATGKMTVALEIDKTAAERGIHSEFVATGQCGIAIAGWGSPIDAIAGDFMAGAVEADCLAVDGTEIILVEGQGSLLHPGFSSVTLALLHGACPHALVLNTQITRTEISKMEIPVPIPPLDQVIRPYIELAAPFRKPDLVAVSVNSVGVGEEEYRAYCQSAEQLLGVPAVDPVREGAGRLVDALMEHRARVMQ